MKKGHVPSRPTDKMSIAKILRGVVELMEALCKDPTKEANDMLSNFMCALQIGIRGQHWSPAELAAADWKKLVTKDQLPQRMCTAFIKLAHNPAASAMQSNVTHAVSELLNVLASCSGASSGIVQASIRQQLQTSGLLQQLPFILDAATEHVMTSARQAQQQPQADPAQHLADLRADATAGNAMSRAAALLALYGTVLELWPFDPALLVSAAGPIAPAALRLAAAVLSRCGWRCGSMTSPQLPPQVTGKLLSNFLPAVNAVTSKVCAMLQAGSDVNTDPWFLQKELFVQQLLKSEGVVPLLAACISCLSCLDLELTSNCRSSTASSSGGGSSSSGGGSSSSSTTAHAGKKVPAAAALLQSSSSLQQLFQCFGVSSITALCAGRTLQQDNPSVIEGLNPMLETYSDVCRYWHDCADPQQQLQTASTSVSHQLVQEQQLHLLLPVMLLHCAASSPAPVAGDGSVSARRFVARYMPAVGACCTGFQRWLQLVPQQSSAAADTTGLQPVLPAEWLAEALPLMLKVADRSIQLVPCDALAANASSEAQKQGIGSSSSSGSPAHTFSRSGSTPDQPDVHSGYGMARLEARPAMALGNAGHSVLMIYMVLALLSSRAVANVSSSVSGCSSRSSRSCSRSSSTQRVQDARAADTAWPLLHRNIVAPHTSQLLRVFDAFARIAAAAAAVVSDSNNSSTNAELPGVLHMNTLPAAQRIFTLFNNKAAIPEAPLVLLAAAAGAGSPEYQQLFSLLGSMLKAGSAASSKDPEWATEATICVARAAVTLLWNAVRPPGSAAAADAGRIADHKPAGAPAGPAAADSLLPALFLFGRCCLHLQASDACKLEPRDVSRLKWPALGVLGCLHPAQPDPALAQHLSAAGHDTQHMQEQLQGLLELLQPAQGTGNPTAAAHPEQGSSAAAELQLQLQSVGAAFTAVAVRCVCNNSSCSNAGGVSEMVLVSGRSCICAGCRTARYCSRTCQRQAWKQHKPVCKALATASAATSQLENNGH